MSSSSSAMVVILSSRIARGTQPRRELPGRSCREHELGVVPGVEVASGVAVTEEGTMTEEPTQERHGPHDIAGILGTPRGQELLGRDIARLAYVAKEGTPRVVPIAITWNGEEIVMCTSTNAPKL